MKRAFSALLLLAAAAPARAQTTFKPPPKWFELTQDKPAWRVGIELGGATPENAGSFTRSDLEDLRGGLLTTLNVGFQAQPWLELGVAHGFAAFSADPVTTSTGTLSALDLGLRRTAVYAKASLSLRYVEVFARLGRGLYRIRTSSLFTDAAGVDTYTAGGETVQGTEIALGAEWFLNESVSVSGLYSRHMIAATGGDLTLDAPSARVTFYFGI